VTKLEYASIVGCYLNTFAMI